MKYQATQRLRIAWRWLPLEVLIVIVCLSLGWSLAKLLGKPVYQAQTDIEITRRVSKRATATQRKKQRAKDINDVGQFSVMPHQSSVLYQASEYAYTHAGIWQPVQDLSESVTAEAVKGQPVLRMTVASSAKAVASENRRAFEAALKRPLKSKEVTRHYQVKLTRRPIQLVDNVMLKPMLKLMAVVGLGLAVLMPYGVIYVRGGRVTNA